MARKHDTPISWLRRLAATLEKVIEAVEEQGGTFDDLKTFLKSSENRENLGRLVMGTLHLLINYSQPFEHELVYTSNIIHQLVYEGEYKELYRTLHIHDGNYSIKGKDGVVRYCSISGEVLKRSDGLVYRSDVEIFFRERGMRFPNAAEALLPPAKDKQFGRGVPMVAFISGSRFAFIVREDNYERNLRQNSRYELESYYAFLAVYE